MAAEAELSKLEEELTRALERVRSARAAELEHPPQCDDEQLRAITTAGETPLLPATPSCTCAKLLWGFMLFLTWALLALLPSRDGGGPPLRDFSRGGGVTAGGAGAPPPPRARSFDLPPYRNDTVGAVLVAFQNPRAVLRTLRLFRDAYPEGDLVLVCDDGCYNYSATAAHFGAHWEGVARRLTTKTDPGWYLRPPQLLAFFRALAYALPLIGSRYYLHLETDTAVHARLPPGPRYTLSGIVPVASGWFTGAEQYYGASLNPFFKRDAWPPSPNPNYPGFQIPYGGQGGTLLHTGFMRALATQPEEHVRAEVALLGGCSTTAGVDYVMTALAYRFNGTVGPLAGAVNRPENYPQDMVAAAAVVHPDKSDYGAPLNDEDRRILGPHWETPLRAPPPQPGDDAQPNPICGGPAGFLQGYAPRPGAEGLAEDARARGEAWDLAEIQGPGYYFGQGLGF
jgi:hypothetical protein